MHVDGAFGLWAAASPAKRHLVEGVERAHSWAVDGHKWLNVPYDAGFVLCADRDAHAASMAYTASYLAGTEAGSWAVESSRRARGFATLGGAARARPRAASPSWWTAAARWPSGSPSGSPRSTAWRSATRSS